MARKKKGHSSRDIGLPSASGVAQSSSTDDTITVSTFQRLDDNRLGRSRRVVMAAASERAEDAPDESSSMHGVTDDVQGGTMDMDMGPREDDDDEMPPLEGEVPLLHPYTKGTVYVSFKDMWISWNLTVFPKGSRLRLDQSARHLPRRVDRARSAPVIYRRKNCWVVRNFWLLWTRRIQMFQLLQMQPGMQRVHRSSPSKCTIPLCRGKCIVRP